MAEQTKTCGACRWRDDTGYCPVTEMKVFAEDEKVCSYFKEKEQKK